MVESVVRGNYKVEGVGQGEVAGIALHNDQRLDRWLEVVELRTTNLKSVVGRLNRHVRPMLGAVSVSRLDAETLESFYAQLRRCRERCGSGRPYIPADRWRLRRSG